MARSMRKIENNVEEIYIEFKKILPNGKQYLLEHTPKEYENLLMMMHHVDTSYRGKSWRVQGYLNIEDFPKASEGWKAMMADAYIKIAEDCVEFWVLPVPFKEEPRELSEEVYKYLKQQNYGRF